MKGHPKGWPFLNFNFHAKYGISGTMKQASVLEWLTAIITILGIALVGFQLSQSNSHKRWDNYNSMNNVYRQMYTQLQGEEFSQLRKKCLNFSKLTHIEKAWIRSYYNLYAEEFDLDEAGLLPKGMMDETISKGFKLNLITYPSISQGFDELLKAGAFGGHTDFSKHVSSEINSVKIMKLCPPELLGK